jgi:hypothetical protein
MACDVNAAGVAQYCDIATQYCLLIWDMHLPAPDYGECVPFPSGCTGACSASSSDGACAANRSCAKNAAEARNPDYCNHPHPDNTGTAPWVDTSFEPNGGIDVDCIY